MSKHRNLNSITERYYIPLVPAFKKTDCTSFHDGTRWFFLLFPPPPKKNMLGSRNAGVMSRTGINQKEIILRKFIVDRSTPNFIKMSSGSKDEIKEPKRPHDLKNLTYLSSSKESSLKSFPCAQLSTTL